MKAEYIDHMGNDLSVVNAARVSFAKQSEFVNGKLKREDENLINFLARGYTTGDWNSMIERMVGGFQSACQEFGIDERHAEEFLKSVKRHSDHWTPFTHTAISLRMAAPVPIRVQCFKHKVGFTENEESRRYISSRPEYYVPEFRTKPEGSIKQGSGGIHPVNKQWKLSYIEHLENSIDMYERMIEGGIAPEQARFVLPQGVIVNWIWTGNLAAFARYYNQRIDSHAQGESQDLAKQVGEIIEPLFPISWKALTQ